MCGKGADTLTGGSGNDVFYYSLGDGKDVISDYVAGEDVIVLDGVAVTKVATVKKAESDLMFTVKKGSIRVNGGVGNRITFKDTSNNILLSQSFGNPYMYVSNSDYATINTAIDAAVVTVDASTRTSDVMLIGNTKNNLIISGKTGNETITTGKGKDTVEYLGGDATITDYTAGSDVIKFTNSEIVSAKLDNSNSVIFTVKDTGTTTTNTVTLLNMVKKKAIQKVTVIDKDGITYAQAFGSPTLTVGNGDGDTVIANSDVTVMNAAKRSKPVYLVGNESDGTLKGGTKDDTIEAGLGDDYVTGGKGNDLFIFTNGNDTIGDYSASKNNMDAITLSSVTFDTYYVDGKNVIMTFKDSTGTNALQESDTSLTILNGKDKSITVNGAARVYNDYYEKIFTKKDTTSTYNAAGSDDSLHTVKLIDASKKTSSIYITGNDFTNGTISTIKGGTKADTLKGGTGDDILTTGKGADRIIYAGGNDTITDYTAGSDIISFDGFDLISAKYNNNDLEFTTSGGTLLIQNAIKKKKDQKITIMNGTASTAQVYGRTELTIGASDGDTLDLSRSVNSDVTTVSASGRSAKAPITIIGNKQADNLTGGKGADTFILATDTGRGKATITYTAGADKILNYKASDDIALGKGVKVTGATKKNDDTYTINFKTGTLDITLASGESATDVFKTSTTAEQLKKGAVKGTGDQSDTTIYQWKVNYYVSVGSNINALYSTTTLSGATDPTKAFEERFEDYFEAVEIFDDTVLATEAEFTNITSIKDNVISIDYDSSAFNITTSQLINDGHSESSIADNSSLSHNSEFRIPNSEFRLPHS